MIPRRKLSSTVESASPCMKIKHKGKKTKTVVVVKVFLWQGLLVVGTAARDPSPVSNSPRVREGRGAVFRVCPPVGPLAGYMCLFARRAVPY